MGILLHTSREVPATGYDRWCAIGGNGGGASGLPVAQGDLALEQAYDAIAEDWWREARTMAGDPGAAYAHTPACAANSSDFGLMLAWTRVVAGLAGKSATTLVVCDDPWLFRHLASLPGVVAGKPPALLSLSIKLFARGLASRLLVSLRAARAALALRSQRKAARPGAPAMLVYGHPASQPDGFDAYFGGLMGLRPDLQRILHVDCQPARARALAGDGRTLSLHAWGAPLAALGLWRCRWRPASRNWLIRRAAALEGSTGQAAMIRWQLHCQARWLADMRPQAVAWPWENHSWERAFVPKARDFKVRTIGYQHTVIGRHEWNHAGFANGAGTLPDHVVCGGTFYSGMLAGWGIPADRLLVAGAWRFPAIKPLVCDPAAPVFVALPAIRAVAEEMMAAITRLAAQGRSFVVREHPMTPVGFVEGPGMRRAPGPLAGMAAVRAVLFAATTVGLEAMLAGVPAIRFRPERVIANDVIPPGIQVPSAGADELADVLDCVGPPAAVVAEAFFAPVNEQTWVRLFDGGAENG